MSGWNIRVVRHICRQWQEATEPETNLELQEVYYGIESQLEPAPAEAQGDYHHGDVSLVGASLEELAEIATRVGKAVFMTKRGFLEVLNCKCDAQHLKLSQEFVDKVTKDDGPDGPDVIGARSTPPPG